MKIGIIGLGIVGGATRDGFQKLGHDISIHDIALNTHIDDVLETELCFICVPTPSKDSGECDTTIVESVVKNLYDKEYGGIICIKSTVSPGTSEILKDRYGKNICFVPEFLRERCATEDFINNHDVCIIGTSSNEFYSKIKDAHGNLPHKVIRLTETEAEFCKYFNNSYNATLITFANSFYEICKSMDVDYTNVKNAAIGREHINDKYLDCNENLRGFGGVCLPKDTRALAALAKEEGVDGQFFKALLEENNKYKTTTYAGMREE